MDARKMHARLVAMVGSVLIVSAFYTGCALYNPAGFVHQTTNTNPKAIGVVGRQITLQWDPPATGASGVTNYIVSFRLHGTSSWTTLATIPAVAQPSYAVQYNDVGAGAFDFGVMAVYSSGADSPEHTSLDATADPTSGWYVNWWGP